MEADRLYIVVAMVLVLVVVLIYAYEKKWLNKLLPVSMQKEGMTMSYGTPGEQMGYPPTRHDDFMTQHRQRVPYGPFTPAARSMLHQRCGVPSSACPKQPCSNCL